MPDCCACASPSTIDGDQAKGAQFTQTFGWERPKWFSADGQEEQYGYRHNNTFNAVREECRAVRERVGVIDLTGFAKYDVCGPDAEAYLNRILANRVSTRDGGITLAHFLSKNGRILGETTVTRVSAQHFYLLSAASAELRDLDHLRQQMLRVYLLIPFSLTRKCVYITPGANPE